ncbi:unnamed protein product [Rhizophagus irregularis]|nr:unnamed protein product [Rhizophagus irregularis]
MSSNDTPYNPAEETINSILTGLLPVLIFGLFNGFEDVKVYTMFIVYSEEIGVEENENNEQENEEKKKKIEEERNDETSISMDEENENEDNEGEKQ